MIDELDTSYSQSEIDEFYSDICSVVEEHSHTDREKSELIELLEPYSEEWLTTYHVTGVLW